MKTEKIRNIYIRSLPAALVTMLLNILYVFPQGSDYYLNNIRYSFIQYDSNYIHISKNNLAFESIYGSIDSILTKGTGKLRILHVGGSHIQADIYTHQIRKRFQGMSPDMNGGRGLIFPYRMVKTNGPSNFRVDYEGNWIHCKNTRNNSSCNLGITGYSVSTTDSTARISIDVNRDSSVHYFFNSVRIFHEPTTYRLSVRINGKEFAGTYHDSLGYSRFQFDHYYDDFQLIIRKDTLDDVFTLSGISFDHDGPGIVYNTVGVNGAMLKSFLGCNLYKKHLRAIAPQLIIFSIGTNDAYTRRFNESAFLQKYRQLLDSTLDAVPGAQIIITVPNDSYLYKRYVNHNTEKMRKIIFRLSDRYGCGVWDFYTVMGGLNSVQAWYDLKMMKYDKVHFNRKGYILKGELFFSAFLKGWEEHLNTRYPVPGNNLNLSKP
jgi:lysophospholipase L1-like esterase